MKFVADDINESALEPGHLKPGRIGTTQMSQNHQHDVILREDGTLETDFKHGHKHPVSRRKRSTGRSSYIVGAPEEMLMARVPIRGDLRFLDRDGQPSPRPARGRLAGRHQRRQGMGLSRLHRGWQSIGAAIWTFDNIDEDDAVSRRRAARSADLPLEMTIRVFRTYKGNIEKGITGKLFLRNPDTKLESEPIIFSSRNSRSTAEIHQARNCDKTGAGDNDPKIDLFNDLVHNGKFEVVLQCLEPGQ